MIDFQERLEECNSYSDIFELVKKVVFIYTGRDQAGLLIGTSDLGVQHNGFVGAFYAPASNMIVLNKRIINKVKRENPDFLKEYIFHLLLHEYVHSTGIYDELEARRTVYKISKYLNDETQISLSTDMGKFFPDLIKSGRFIPSGDITVDFFPGIDRKNTNYIY